MKEKKFLPARKDFNAKSCLFCLVFVFLFFFFSCSSSKGSINNSNWSISSISDETTLTSDDLKGKIAVIHFFASWCPPCRQEFPEFIKWEKENANSNSFVVIPISLDKSKSAARAYYNQNETNLLCYFDKGEAANSFNIKAIPTTVIVDENGNIVFRKEGSVDWASGEADKVIEKIKGS